ncbi:redox-sensing transcriptional repressor Rex [Porphyromonas sp. COT-239 OH1446]|uniref:redox-sensing transcriptional repressor Rex n=1 Tax=Porphyromonas sp. COT-239 OH1446 TaxID=1515613 RepID=UPI00052DE495|nr:redox-sensing transcriptional repressor Rex [Porphyromonas sp. COT-239 OH1446]KGN70005.1 REX family transcriptional regulator [Porphyromonas sp. COT-239 OH1446]
MTSSKKKANKSIIPEPALRRLPWYLSFVKMLRMQGESLVSSTRIARGVGVDAALVAKDLSYVNLQGRTRVGYRVEEMVEVLEAFLGFTIEHRAVLLGVGNLGAALLADKGLAQFGLEIVAAYDVSEAVVGQVVSDVPVYHIDALEEMIAEQEAQIAILTVPIGQAQLMADKVTQLGFKAIWNFTPVRIQVPEPLVVQNTSLYAHLAVMFSRISTAQALSQP